MKLERQIYFNSGRFRICSVCAHYMDENQESEEDVPFSDKDLAESIDFLEDMIKHNRIPVSAEKDYRKHYHCFSILTSASKNLVGWERILEETPYGRQRYEHHVWAIRVYKGHETSMEKFGNLDWKKLSYIARYAGAGENVLFIDSLLKSREHKNLVNSCLLGAQDKDFYDALKIRCMSNDAFIAMTEIKSNGLQCQNEESKLPIVLSFVAVILCIILFITKN